MHSTPTPATRFARTFAIGKHQSRSERYAYIPTRDPTKNSKKSSLGKSCFGPMMKPPQRLAGKLGARGDNWLHVCTAHARDIGGRYDARKARITAQHDRIDAAGAADA